MFFYLALHLVGFLHFDLDPRSRLYLVLLSFSNLMYYLHVNYSYMMAVSGLGGIHEWLINVDPRLGIWRYSPQWGSNRGGVR